MCIRDSAKLHGRAIPHRSRQGRLRHAQPHYAANRRLADTSVRGTAGDPAGVRDRRSDTLPPPGILDGGRGSPADHSWIARVQPTADSVDVSPEAHRLDLARSMDLLGPLHLPA